MNIQRLNYFLAVAEEANFGRAAARIGMKQPPLSQSIRRLERDLGVALLERTRTGVRLTAAGEAFLPEAQAAVSSVARAAALARAAASTRTAVRIGVVSVALWDPVPRLVAAAQQAKIPIYLEQATTNEQLRALASGGLDLGLVAPPFEAPPRLQVTPLANEPIVAVLPAKLAPNDNGPVALAKITDRLILFPRADGPVLYDAIFAMFRTRGLAPTIVQESPRMLTTLALVAAGVGASLVPAAISRNLSVIGAAFRPLDLGADVPRWPIALAHMPLSARSDAARLLTHYWLKDPRESKSKARGRRR
jgi:DNA-binding transcriptional LysR family regulator